MSGSVSAELVVLRAALHRVRQELPADNATIAVPDQEPGYIRTAASATDAPDELWQSRFAFRDGIAGEAAATGQVVIVPDVSHFPQFRPIGRRTIKSILAFPIGDYGRIRGVVTVTSSRAAAFSSRSVQALASVIPVLEAALALSERAAWGAYLAGLAHDMCSPVSSVSGFLQLAGDRTADTSPAQRAEYVRLATVAVDQLVHLAGDMHDVLSLGRQNLRLEFSTFDAVAMLLNTLASLAPLAAEAGVHLRHELQEDVLLMHADRHRLERILSNLVQNAIKFTPVGRHVTVRLGLAEAGTIDVTIDDEGPGLADADLPYLFDLNYQSEVGGRTARRRQGLGLGLAIARMLTRAHGGELTAANRPGGGARFTLRVPTDGSLAAASGFPEPGIGR